MAKILIIATVLQPPINAGSKACIAGYCKLLKEQGHELYYLYLGKAPTEDIKAAKEYWNNRFFQYEYSFILRVANYISRLFYHNKLKKNYNIGYFCPRWGGGRRIKQVLQHTGCDYVIFNYIWLSPLFKYASNVKKILFTHDCFSNKSERIQEDKYSLTPNQESRALSKCDIILAIQEKESHVFEVLAPHKNIYTVYMPIEYKHTAITKKKNILFFSGDSDLNRNGIRRFIKNVFIPLNEENPDISLIIGGGICQALQQTYHHNKIHFIGIVDNPMEIYKLGDIVVNPVYQGTGLKIKTLEGIAFGKYLVVDPHSTEGLYDAKHVPVVVAPSKEIYIDTLKIALSNTDNLEIQKIKCENYINRMNQFIKEQYKEIFR